MITKFMKNLDVVVNMAASLGLFLLISVIFIWHLPSLFIIYTLLPIISTVLVWKFMYSHYTMTMNSQVNGDSAARTMNVTCVDYEE